MRKSIILLVFIMMLLTSSLASAQFAKPGSKVPVKVINYKFKTSTLLVPLDWKPTHIRYELCNPGGEVVYWQDGPISSVSQSSSGYEGATHYTIWLINDNKGFIEIPAFAEQGKWTVKARIYDKLFGIWDYHQDTETLYTVDVGQSQPWETIMGPYYFHFSLPLIGDFCFGTPDLIYLIAIIVIVVIILVNIKMILPKKVKA